MLHVADAEVADAPFDHDQIAAERHAKVMEGIELQRKGRFDLGAAARNVCNGHGLKHHDFATELAQDFNPIRVTSRVRPVRHKRGPDHFGPSTPENLRRVVSLL